MHLRVKLQYHMEGYIIIIYKEYDSFAIGVHGAWGDRMGNI